MAPRTVLVTGANGFLGSAVARIFAISGWQTYGLIRDAKHAPGLLKDEIIPVVGSAADTSWVANLPALNVIASTTEDVVNYVGHFNDSIDLFKVIAARYRDIQGRAARPLVIFTSGCKDYGTTLYDGHPDLQPHTEESPLNGPPQLAPRTKHSLTIFSHSEDFDAVLTRPTTFYGRTGTYYGPIFTLAQQAKDDGLTELVLPSDPRSIMHGTHGDDVASAYVAIATSPRDRVVGQVFNISSHRYETAREVAAAIEKSYGLKVKWSGEFASMGGKGIDFVHVLFGFSQWVGSEKIRRVTGWTDRKPLFAEMFDVYRLSYEAYLRESDSQVVKMKARVADGKSISSGKE
ncbi:uncharacterized protein A1O9_04969 [Exophiala aquamarina CBS 119918]|uniref:NAD-dependent epimerase/dehydratase domain-containing protein n=1 Tax=Exophiala aquamarina CBS 119918 TaxID=1182545 RepID=A0A072PJ08_9EURO|nr:uncharacterized protein A1O9_04969 [Exophiala aquamarina CBS 119918]KEF60119.1 hypothetical protein A1O9_04969 [Exophiala aquamarina CBS 119918]